MLSLVPVIHASISKLHPEVALEELEEMLDLNSFSHVLDRVLEASGLKREGCEASKLRGSEADSMGELQPGGADAGSPTGRISTAPSQPPPAGPFPK